MGLVHGHCGTYSAHHQWGCYRVTVVHIVHTISGAVTGSLWSSVIWGVADFKTNKIGHFNVLSKVINEIFIL